jgi:hypothetical protein
MSPRRPCPLRTANHVTWSSESNGSQGFIHSWIPPQTAVNKIRSTSSRRKTSLVIITNPDQRKISTVTMASKAKLDPLREFLDAVVTRIENLEAHVGLAVKTTTPTVTPTPGGGVQKRPSVKHIQGTGTWLPRWTMKRSLELGLRRFLT